MLALFFPYLPKPQRSLSGLTKALAIPGFQKQLLRGEAQVCMLCLFSCMCLWPNSQHVCCVGGIEPGSSKQAKTVVIRAKNAPAHEYLVCTHHMHLLCLRSSLVVSDNTNLHRPKNWVSSHVFWLRTAA